jgi:tetratricopeptide (TPR) repeat protein
VTFLALAALVLSTAMQLAGCQPDARIQVEAVGCAVLHADGGCEPPDHGGLRLLVRADRPFGQVLVYQGQREVPTMPLPGASDRERMFHVQLDPRISGLMVRVRTSRFRWVPQPVPVRARQEADWLHQARLAWKDNAIASAEAYLREALDTGQPRQEEELAIAHGILGRIERERGHRERAQELLEKALAEDIRAGLVFHQINDTLALSYMAIQQHRVHEAQERLESLAPALDRMPDMKGFVWLQRALLARVRGDVKLMLRAIDEGIDWASRYQDREALSECLALAADVSSWLGQYDEATDYLHRSWSVLEVASVEEPEPCRRADRLIREGRWRMDALRLIEGHPEEIRFRKWPRRDPRSPLREALDLIENKCTQEKLLAEGLTELTRADLLAQDWTEAERSLAKAERSPSLREAERAELRGQLALGRGEPARALAEFQKLLRLAAQETEPDRRFDERWRAWVGIGQSQETTDPAAAIKAYEEAERILDAWVLYLPLTGMRMNFLGKHSQPLGRHLQLLVQQGRADEALRVSRRAGLRLYREYHQANRLSDLPPTQRLAWGQALGAYEDLNRQWSAVVARLSEKSVPAEEGAKLAGQRTQLEKALLRLTEEALSRLGGAKEGPLPEPNAGDVLLTCQTVPSELLCLAADPDGVQAVPIARPDWERIAQTLGTRLLPPLADKLRKAHRLRILARGALQQIDFHRLPWPGPERGTLEEHLDVAYSLDLPPPAGGAPTPAAQRLEQALLLIHPQGIRGFSRVAHEVETRLVASLQPRYQVKVAPEGQEDATGGWPWSKPVRPVPAMNLHDALSQSDLFVYLGHVPLVSDEGLQPRLLTASGGFKVSDILVLDRVPRGVLLAGCETGRLDDAAFSSSGGEIRLPQAFLLRGGEWVIGTVRPVSAGIAADVVEALMVREGLGAPGMNPASALRQTRQWVRRHLAPSKSLSVEDQESHLDAFRVLVP